MPNANIGGALCSTPQSLVMLSHVDCGFSNDVT